MANSWLASDATFKEFASKPVDELALYNQDLEKELHKDHLDFLAGKVRQKAKTAWQRKAEGKKQPG
jgi:hypothetical protein